MKRITKSSLIIAAAFAAFTFKMVKPLADDAVRFCLYEVIPNGNCPGCATVVTSLFLPSGNVQLRTDEKPKDEPKPEIVATLQGARPNVDAGEDSVFRWKNSLSGVKLSVGDKFPVNQLQLGNDLPTLLLIGASWCMPCHANEGVLSEHSKKYSGGVYAKTLDLGERKVNLNMLVLKMDDEQTTIWLREMGIVEPTGNPLPIVFLLGRDGTILGMGMTVFDDTHEGRVLNKDLVDALNRLK